MDHAPDQVRVNAVCLGPIFTPYHERRTLALGLTLEQYREGAVLRACAPHAQDFTQRKAGRHQTLSRAERAANRQKSRVRARVEHPIGVIKRVFGF